MCSRMFRLLILVITFFLPLLLLILLLRPCGSISVLGENSAVQIIDSLTMGNFSISNHGSRRTLLSPRKKFALGFFSPQSDRSSSSNGRFVGIWYYKDPQTVVWVANRDKPVPDNSTGVFTIDKDGNLKLIPLNGGNKGEPFFSADSKVSSKSTRTVVKLDDFGNLRLTDENEAVLWESFKYPTDTFLPGMLFTNEMELVSWKDTGKDPGRGDFIFMIDNDNLIIQNSSVGQNYWTSGSNKGFGETLRNLLHCTNNVPRGKMSCEFDNYRLLMNSSGELLFFNWDNNKTEWLLDWLKPSDACDVNEACGKYGVCNTNDRPHCKCMAWFEAKSPDQWKSGDYTNGCYRKKELCDGGGVNQNIFYLLVMENSNNNRANRVYAENEDECRTICNKNCNCEAYSYNNVGRKTEQKLCQHYTSSLMDLTLTDGLGYTNELGNNLFVRVVVPNKEARFGICGIKLIPYPLCTNGSFCDYPSYNGFHCINSPNQLYFNPSEASDSYRVTDIYPDKQTFVIQLGDAKQAARCESKRNQSLSKLFQFNPGSPFKVQDWCFNQGKYNEVEIVWEPPLEPSCNSDGDCQHWPENSKCVAVAANGGGSRKKCLCNQGFIWDRRSLNCTSAVKEPGVLSQASASPQEKPPHFFPSNVIWVTVMSALLLFFGVVTFANIFYRKRMAARSQESRERSQMDPRLQHELHDMERQITELVEAGLFEDNDNKSIDVPSFDLESILTVTNNFSEENMLGRGGFGPVYKGRFPGGQEVAVKRLLSHSGQGLVEFRNEVLLIAKLQHRNLVRLLGYCISGDEKSLVYEYMPNKSLDAFIFDQTLSMSLGWKKRFIIISGIARGLLYLHQDSRLRIIHRDLKTSNVLLDEEMNPKISDFGLAKMVEGNETGASTETVIGTFGYMAPEYALHGLFSIKSDVFSFGVVVLEIISGRRNTGFYQSEEAFNLLGYAWGMWNAGTVMNLVDQTFIETCDDVREISKCITIGLLCTQEQPGDRPTMSDVVFWLGSENPNLGSPKRPAFVLTKRHSNFPDSSSCSKPETFTSYTTTSSLEGGE